MKEYEILVKNNESKEFAVAELQYEINRMKKYGWKTEGIQSSTELKYEDATMYVVSQVMKRKK